MTARIENFHDANWVTADVHFRRTDGTPDHRFWILNRISEKGYHFESTSDTAMKCGMIAIGLPFWGLFKVICYVIRAVILPFCILAQTRSLKELVVNVAVEIPAAIIECIWSIVKTPFCVIGMTFCCLCGISAPLTWRVHLANIEGFWCSTLKANFTGQNYTRRFDVKESNGEHFGKRFVDFFSNRHSPYCFHMAYCFQPVGSLRDPHIIHPYRILTPT